MISIFKKAYDPISSYTHFLGAIFSVFGLFLYLMLGFKSETTIIDMVGCVIFGLSLILLYSASSVYHFFSGDEKVNTILRKLDHAMIYVLIVGTYTPVTLAFVEFNHAIVFLSILWFVAFVGIIIKLLWMNAPRFISTLIYLALGWAIIFDMKAFYLIPMNCLILIAIGGISYSIGAIIYILKKPNISIYFGFHEVFHIFVMLGSFMHYIAIMLFVI